MTELKIFEYITLGLNGFLFTIWTRKDWFNALFKFGFLCMIIWSVKIILGGN